jgi:hypothetical protein
MTIIDTDDIRSHYRGHGHWFDADAIRFFHSRVAATAYKTDDGSRAYFVSSERYDFDTARKFTVRVYNFETHDIRTVGEFQAYASRSGADAAARRLARHSSGEAVGV